MSPTCLTGSGAVIRAEAGTEMSAAPVDGAIGELISPAGMEEIRRLMAESRASPELAGMGDADLPATGR